MEKDVAKTERKERERRKDLEGQPPPIPEKVKKQQGLGSHCSRLKKLPNSQEVRPAPPLSLVGKRPL